MDSADFPEVVDRLEAEVDEGLFTRGAQIAVVRDGELVLDAAFGDDGTGRPMAPDTVLRVYCSIKPVTAMAIGHLLDDGTLELDQPLVELLPGPKALADGRVTLRHVLNHTAGLHRPMAIEIEIVAPPKRIAHADAIGLPAAWPVGRQAAYSEYYGWSVLGRLIEATTGDDLRAHLRERVLDPLGLSSTWVGMTADEYAEVRDRLGTSFDMRTDRPFPLLLERGRRMCTEVNAAHGGYTTAGELARFYDALLRSRAGADVAGLPRPATVTQFTSPQRPRSFDGVLDRECTYGFGFMTGLVDHAFGSRCSETTFGHSGNVGATFAFADPERDLAVGVVFNGVVDAESAFLRRPALVAALYRDLDALAAASDDAADDDGSQAEPTDGRRRRRLWSRR